MGLAPTVRLGVDEGEEDEWAEAQAEPIVEAQPSNDENALSTDRPRSRPMRACRLKKVNYKE